MQLLIIETSRREVLGNVFLRFILQVAALMTAVHWVVHGGARDALEYQVSQERF